MSNLKMIENCGLAETHDALTLLRDELNHGQQMKLLKNAEVEKLLRRFGVIDDADG